MENSPRKELLTMCFARVLVYRVCAGSSLSGGICEGKPYRRIYSGIFIIAVTACGSGSDLTEKGSGIGGGEIPFADQLFCGVYLCSVHREYYDDIRIYDSDPDDISPVP